MSGREGVSCYNAKLTGSVSRSHDSQGIEHAERVLDTVLGEGRPSRAVRVTSEPSQSLSAQSTSVAP